MIRVIKRYESRKLYDTEESRYVSLEDISQWVRDGQEVRVVDNASGEDVSSQILTQIILDEGKRGTSFLPSELLHELVRAGEKALTTGVEQVQTKVDRWVQSSIDRLGPVRRARQEMARLRDRLSELEGTLADLDAAPASKPRRRSAAKKPAVRRSATATKTASKKAVATQGGAAAAKPPPAASRASKSKAATGAKKRPASKAAAKKPTTRKAGPVKAR